MFISTEFLAINYGVDTEIARFFVDRDPPAGNLYWHDKLLYLRPAVGYLFIPLIVDLLYKTDIAKEDLLSEKFVGCMEHIGHISALEETGQISRSEAISQCVDFIKPKTDNANWFSVVSEYLSNRPSAEWAKQLSGLNALHRGDVFLLSLAVLRFPEAMYHKVIKTWFALITTLLLLDDAEDLENDKLEREENAFIESGLNKEGFLRIKELVNNNLQFIKTINPVLSTKLAHLYRNKVERVILEPVIQQ